MTTLQVTIPESLKAHVDAVIAAGTFESADSYIQQLLSDDQNRQETRRQVDQMLIEGLESGPAEDLTPERWKEIRRKVRSSRLNCFNHA